MTGAAPHGTPLDPNAFDVHRAEVREGLELAYIREGAGGYPLVMLHGWPETKRIWWRNIEPLARAGFEVIVPDLRGFGDSGVAPDGFYDQAAVAGDVYALVHDLLGHERCSTCGGDWGGVVAQELGLRHRPLVDRQCLFNTIMPFLDEEYAAAGIHNPSRRERVATADYFFRQGNDADGLAAELDTPERRRNYIRQFYGPRLWSPPGSFDEAEAEFMAEPFCDADKLRASISLYEVPLGKRTPSEMPRFFERNDLPTLLLWGPEDSVIWRDSPQRAEIAFSERIGPLVVPNAGHFLQWERADLLNQCLIYFLADLRG